MDFHLYLHHKRIVDCIVARRPFSYILGRKTFFDATLPVKFCAKYWEVL